MHNHRRKITKSKKIKLRLNKKFRLNLRLTETQRKIAGVFCLILAFGLFSLPAIYKNISRSLQKAAASGQGFGPIKIDKKLTGGNQAGELPVRIILPSLSIDLPVTPSKVINGYWELSENTASYGLGSGIPGRPGNTIIFAHARDPLFGPLKGVKTGEYVYLFTKARWYSYLVKNVREVWPNETQLIAPTPDQTLTLFTCSGFLDTKRLIVTAKPV